MEKRELRKRLVRLQEEKINMKAFLNRIALTEKERSNAFKSYYVLEGRIRELQIIIAEEDLNGENSSN